MKFVNLHTHRFEARPNVLSVVNQYPWEFDATLKPYSIGIHPWYIDEGRLESDLKTIAEKLSDSNCLALGECGLDKRIEIPLELQRNVFTKQIALAERARKPMILHLVAAYQELIEIRRELKPSVPMILHGFSKNAQVAHQLLDHGFHLSFGKYLLRNPELADVLREVPNDRLFLETDTAEESIEQVYAVASAAKGISIDAMIELVWTNFERVFQHTPTLNFK